jgi:hypothetical protein
VFFLEYKSTAKRRISLRRQQTCTWSVQKTSKCGQDQFCDMPDADPTHPHTPHDHNQSAINYQVRRVGTKMVAHGCPQQHPNKLVILSKMLEIQCKNRAGELINELMAQIRWAREPWPQGGCVQNFPRIKNFGRLKCSKKSSFLSNHVVVGSYL